MYPKVLFVFELTGFFQYICNNDKKGRLTMLKIFRSSIIVLFSFLVLVFPNYSIAELQSVDDPDYGEGAITYDTETGLEWLDFTFTKGMAYEEVSYEFGPGGYLEGFRRPTIAEINDLLAQAGISYLYHFTSDPLIMEDDRTFIQMLGPTRIDYGYPGFMAWTGSCDSNGEMCLTIELHTVDSGMAYYLYYISYNTQFPWNHLAHFAVRQASPVTRVIRLRDAVEDLNLNFGISNSLDSKLSVASQALDGLNENNDGAAINKLQAFINAVEAQWGKHIPVDDAEALIATAQGIIDTLSSQ